MSLGLGARLVDGPHGLFQRLLLWHRVPALALSQDRHTDVDDRQPFDQLAVSLAGMALAQPLQQIAVDVDSHGAHMRQCTAAHSAFPHSARPSEG